MCRGCWLERGAPSVLPDNADEIVGLLKQLYEKDIIGGPLHVAVDDWNLEDTFFNVDEVLRLAIGQTWSTETVGLARQIAGLMLELPLEQRAAVLARKEGFT